MKSFTRIFHSVALILCSGFLVSVTLTLLGGMIPRERPMGVIVGAMLSALMLLTLVAGFGHALYRRRPTVDQRFLMVAMTLSAVYLLINLVRG